jgi:spore coat protein JB
MNKMNQQQLMLFITEVTFALDDIGLFLDTHPRCQQAMAAYGNYKNMRNQAIKDYNQLYGPINKYQVNDSNYFDWVNDPWPWEKECGC